MSVGDRGVRGAAQGRQLKQNNSKCPSARIDPENLASSHIRLIYISVSWNVHMFAANEGIEKVFNAHICWNRQYNNKTIMARHIRH